MLKWHYDWRLTTLSDFCECDDNTRDRYWTLLLKPTWKVWASTDFVATSRNAFGETHTHLKLLNMPRYQLWWKFPSGTSFCKRKGPLKCTCKYSVIDACWRLEANKRIAVSLSFYWLRVALGLIEPSRNWQCYRLFLEDKGGQYSYIQLQLLGDENESRQPLHQDHMMQQKLIKEGHWEGSRGMFCPLLLSNQKSVSLSLIGLFWSCLKA